MSARDMREACARACLRAADECPGTEDEVATWREAVMWCVNAIRALPLAPAPIAAPADDAVARAREAVIDAAKRVRKEREYREQTSMCDNYTDHARSRQREQDAIEDLLRAALAAERAASGPATGDEKGNNEGGSRE